MPSPALFVELAESKKKEELKREEQKMVDDFAQKIDITNSHASNFTNRVVTIRGALRGALVTRKPYFFCTVTGL